MNKIKIIHCSDFHFDTAFSDFEKDKAEIRREDIRETFGKVINMAKDNLTDILLIAGDVFDNSTVSYETINLMKKKFEEIPKTRIFISPGNHDPFAEKSYYNIVQWPSNVYIFKERLEEINIDELNLTVYGAGFTSNYVRESLLKDFSVSDSTRINMMVLHGEVVKGNLNSNYNPISEDDMATSGLDYLALGHVHSFSGINRLGSTYWSYSGCPEGRGFDELGSKGVLLGQIGKGYVDLELIETCKRRYKLLEVDVTGCDNYEDIIIKVNQSLGLDKGNSGVGDIYKKISEDIYKILLKGRVNPDFIINTSIIEEKFRYYFYYLKIKDNTEYEIDYNSIAEEITLKGIFVKKMLEKIKAAGDEKEKDRLQAALKMGLDALELKEVKIL